MGYLVCDKCGGYYELQKGESRDDFDICECGGKLEYVEKIGNTNEPPNEVIKCPSCGKENTVDSKYCLYCGDYMKSMQGSKNLLGFLDYPALFTISVFALLVFFLSTFIFDSSSIVLFTDSNSPPTSNGVKATYYTLIILIGVITGLLVRGNYKKNVLHGALVLMPAVIFGVISFYSQYSAVIDLLGGGSFLSLAVGGISIVMLLIMIVAYAFLGGIGGLIGSIIHDKSILDNKSFLMKITEKIYHNGKISSNEMKFGYISFICTVLLLSLWSLVG